MELLCKVKKYTICRIFVLALLGLILTTPSLFPSKINFAGECNDQKLANKFPSIELTIRYDKDENRIELMKQRLVNFAAPKRRITKPRFGELLFLYQNNKGKILGSFPIRNPVMLYADWPAETFSNEPGLLTGKRLTFPASEFIVILPFSEHLERVMLLKPSFFSDGTIEVTETVGRCKVDRDAIRHILKNNKKGRT